MTSDILTETPRPSKRTEINQIEVSGFAAVGAGTLFVLTGHNIAQDVRACAVEAMALGRLGIPWP